jgi:hypothetical protein
MVHFRKLFSEQVLNRINGVIAERGKDMVMEACWRPQQLCNTHGTPTPA